MKRHILFCGVAASSFVVASAAQAQTASSPSHSAVATASSVDTQDAGLADIIVTAQRVSENSQKVPITISAFSDNDLRAANVRSVQDISTLVPGFVGPGSNGLGSTHIRGVGSQITQPGVENSIATYVDGVYIGAVSPALLSLNNVRQIEVLRGPQGTLFGRNTTGGVIQINTRDPGPDTSIEARASYANYNTTSGWLYANVPLADGVATNLSVQAQTQGDGWGRNIVTGNDAYKVKLELSVRNRWAFQLGSGTKLELIGDYEHRRDVGFFALRQLTGYTNVVGYTSTVKGWDVAEEQDQRNQTEAWGVAARLSQDVGFGTITNTLAYRRTDYDQINQDGDLSPVPFLVFSRFTSNRQFTEEFQVTSNQTGPLTWVAGLFYYNAKDLSRIPQTFPLPAFLPPPLTGLDQQIINETILSRSYAGYAQASYKITPSTTITGGYRYTHDEHSLDAQTDLVFMGVPIPGAPLANDFSTDSSSWRVSLTQDVSDNLMVYGSINIGSKPGGYNPSFPANGPFFDERLHAYEIGTKATFLDNHVHLSLSGFRYDYDNIQVNGFLAGQALVYNGAAAQMTGVDAELMLKPTRNLTIRGAAEYLHSKFKSFPNVITLTPLPMGGYFQGTGDATGLSLPYAPEFSGSAQVNYAIPAAYGTWDFSASYSYNSGYWTDPAHIAGLEQPAYHMVGASVQFTAPNDRWYAQIWGANLANEQVYNVLGASVFGTFAGLNAPRTYGVTLGFKFR